MNSMALPIDASLRSQNDEMIAEEKFTQSIWLYVSIWYPLNSLSWNVEVKPSKPRYPSMSAMPYMPVSAAPFDAFEGFRV